MDKGLYYEIEREILLFYSYVFYAAKKNGLPEENRPNFEFDMNNHLKYVMNKVEKSFKHYNIDT